MFYIEFPPHDSICAPERRSKDIDSVAMYVVARKDASVISSPDPPLTQHFSSRTSTPMRKRVRPTHLLPLGRHQPLPANHAMAQRKRVELYAHHQHYCTRVKRREILDPGSWTLSALLQRGLSNDDLYVLCVPAAEDSMKERVSCQTDRLLDPHQ